MAEVKFKFVGDDSELRKKLAGLAKLQAEMSDKFGKNLKKTLAGASSNSLKGISDETKKSTAAVKELSDEQKKLKAAQLENIESIRRLREERSKEISDLNILKQLEAEHKATLADKKKETESLIQEEKMLNIEYKQGRIELQEYTRKLKEQAESRRKANAEERAAEKVLRDAEKARKDSEREAEKQRKAAEKRRKELEKESSAYYQLNKALNNVRKESKDVLSEMFKLEGEGKKTSAAYQELANKARGLVAQTQYLDNGIKKIDASLGLHQRNVGNYTSALDNIIPIVGRVNSQLAMFGTSIDELAGKPGIFKEIGAGIAGAFKNLVAFVSTPIGAAVATIGGLFALFQANKDTVIQFDDGLKSVSKTTGLSGKALQQYSDDIIQLSRALKTVESKQLLEYSQVAGQLGVKGRDNLLAFSEALAKLETASDIRGEEGATKIARLLTLTDGGVQNVKEFGDEIVNLGNNFAATESEILTNAEAIGQNVGLYKIGRKDVLAYATATKAVGLEAEVVGSTFSRTLGQFEKMTRSGKGVNDLLKIIGGTQADLQKRFKTDASGVFMDYIRGLNKINQAGGSVNEALERTGIIAVRDQRVIASLASTGYDTLTNAMNTAKNASGAMQAEFETGASKLVNQIKRINIAWDNLVLSIENGSGAIGKTSVAIIGYVADMLEAFNKIADSANIFEGVFRYISTGFKMTIPGRAVDWATGGGFDKVSNWIFPNDSKKASEDNSKFFAEFSQKTRAEQLKMIANQEELIKKQNSLNKAFANPVLEENLKKMRSLLKTDVDTSKIDFGVSDKDKRKSERAAEQLRQATERQRSLQLEIDKINETASRNQLSRDESEVASVKDKYAKIKEEVRKFYDDPKNKGLKVNTSGLVASENFEISEAEIRQNTKAMETQFDAQKKLLDEYNAYAEQTSKEAADDRFASELAIFKDYEKNVEKAYDDLLTKKKTADLAQNASTIKFTQAEEEQLKALGKRKDDIANENRQRENRRLIDALKLSETYDQKRLAIEKKYQDALAALGSKATPEQKATLDKSKKEELSNISIDEFMKNSNWGEVFATIIYKTRSEALKSLTALKDGVKNLLDEGKISAVEFRQLVEQIESSNYQISHKDKGLLGDFKADLDILKKAKKGTIEYEDALAKTAQSANAVFQSTLSAVGDIGGIFDKLGIGNEEFQEGLGKTIQALGDAGNLAVSITSGDVLGMITNGVKFLSSAIDLFNTKDKKLQKQIDAYKTQLDSLGKAYDRLQGKLSNSDTNYYDNQNLVLKNLNEQEQAVRAMMKAEEEKKKTDKDKMKAYRDQLDEIDKRREDVEKAARQMRLQTDINSLSQSIADALLSAFEAGEDGIESMDKAFDKFIKNVLVNSLRLKLINPIVEDMVNKLDQYMAKNDNSPVGFNFDDWRDKLNGVGKTFNEAMESAFAGLGLEKESSSSTEKGSLKNDIQGISEQQAGRLEAEFGGLRIAQLQLLETTKSNHTQLYMIAQDKLTQLIAIQQNTYRTANNTDRLANIENAIVSLNNKVSSSDAARRGAGL
ncbi:MULTISPECIES: phage tail tape measure protein [Sphingobacterium]|uniref:phage tail tape measure protein n=1 Tax=Sphingobacterium TaxID=28453 RepID=UPI00257BE07C|nr:MULTISPECIES: phage tail tape measure protein [Sphingobacterium]